MAQVSGAGNVIDVSNSGNPLHAQRLFYGCFASMFATSFGFIVRALLLNDFGRIFNLTEAAKKGPFKGLDCFLLPSASSSSACSSTVPATAESWSSLSSATSPAPS